jgi:hypothetical protein
MFLTLMVIGLVGLAAMALPALGRHGAFGHAQLTGHVAHPALAAASTALVHKASPTGIMHFLPSPRSRCTAHSATSWSRRTSRSAGPHWPPCSRR